MNKYIAYLQIYFAYLLYLFSAITFIDYMYSLTIPDTVTAIENAFGTLVILVFMLVMAKFSRAAGKARLQGHTGEKGHRDEAAKNGNGETSSQDEKLP